MNWELFIQFLAACLGTVSFSVLFYVPREYYPVCAVIGGTGWMVYLVGTGSFQLSTVTATFLATSLVTLLSRIAACQKKCPVTLFLISGIFPLVPGIGFYRTVYAVIMGDTAMSSLYGRQSVNAAVAIVLGIVIIFEVPQQWIVKAFVRKKGKEKNSGQ